MMRILRLLLHVPNYRLRKICQLICSPKLFITTLLNLCQLQFFLICFSKLWFKLPFKTKEMPVYNLEITILKLNLYLYLLLNRIGFCPTSLIGFCFSRRPSVFFVRTARVRLVAVLCPLTETRCCLRHVPLRTEQELIRLIPGVYLLTTLQD